MPRPPSSHTSVHEWPDQSAVHAAASAWAQRAVHEHEAIRGIGYIGSYARGDWGVGSDLDLIVIVAHQLPPVGERARGWDTLDIPVPVELLLHSEDEWQRLLSHSPRMAATVAHEAVWLYRAEHFG